MIRQTAIAFLFFLTLLAKADIHKGRVASYTFNNGIVKDESGHNHPKVSEAVLVDDRFGNKQSAYYLYGNPGSYINLGTSSLLKPYKGSISLWFYMENIAWRGKGYTCNPIILTKNLQQDDFFEGYNISYEYVAGKLVVGMAIDSTLQINELSTEKTTLREWHHIVMAFDNDFLWLYVDGKLQNDHKPVRKPFRNVYSPTDSVLIGNSNNKKNDRFFCGIIDDIYFYNRVISEDEVLELYQAPDFNRYAIYLKWAYWCIGIILMIAFFTWLMTRRYKKEVEKQKERALINIRLNELETKAIRTQMNPHFIFNSLNTLQRFILEEDFQNSNLYLTKFSLLLRKLIESSVLDFISLDEEIDILHSYIEIESMRFEHAFEYTIHNAIADPKSVYIPFMLVQPFVENAIWHGLLPKKGMRRMKIEFSALETDRILCIVDDNGIGRQNHTTKNPLKKKSLAIDFIRQRLDLLEKSTGIKCSFVITDRLDEQGNPAGTKVNIVIPRLKYDIELFPERKNK